MPEAVTWSPTHLPARLQDLGGRRVGVVSAVRLDRLLVLLDTSPPQKTPIHLEIDFAPDAEPTVARGTVREIQIPAPGEPLHGLVQAPLNAIEIELDSPSVELLALLTNEIEAYQRQRRVLIIDDDLLQLALLRQILLTLGFDPVCVSTPFGATSTIVQAEPCLILLDIQMPELDGREVCKRIHEDERTKTIPVVFLSALNEKALELRSPTRAPVASFKRAPTPTRSSLRFTPTCPTPIRKSPPRFQRDLVIDTSAEPL
jgi:CheY-like chemotaxis protein